MHRPYCTPPKSALLALLLLFATGASAAAQPILSVRGNVGASFFQAPSLEEELLNSGTDLGIEADVWVYRGLAVTVQGNYDQFTLNQQTAQLFALDGVTLGDLSFTSGSLGLRYTFLNDGDAHPYIAGGVGVYHVRRTDGRTYVAGGAPGSEPDAETTQRGFHVAAGANFRLDDTYAVFFEPRYVFLSSTSDGILGAGTETPRYFTLRLGLDVRLWQ